MDYSVIHEMTTKEANFIKYSNIFRMTNKCEIEKNQLNCRNKFKYFKMRLALSGNFGDLIILIILLNE